MLGLPNAMRATVVAAVLFVVTAGMRLEGDGDAGHLTTPNLRVNLLVTRHALSCANIVNSNGEGVFGSRQHTLMLDPAISQCGTARSQRASEAVAEYLQNRTIDFVLSSSLRRAMETAMSQYPGHVIVPVPYLSEHSPGYDNIPADVSSQVASLSTRHPDVHARIDFKWMRHHVFGAAEHRYNNPSFASFLRFLTEDFLPQEVSYGQDLQELNIVVVTHSHFMKDEEPIASRCRDFWDEGTGKPRNNQVVELSYDISRAGIQQGISVFPVRNASLVQVDGQYCRDVFVAYPKVPRAELCEADVGEHCMAEMESLTWRPSLLTKEREIERLAARHETALARALTDLASNQTMRAEESTAYAARVQAELEALRALPCCAA